MMTSRLPLFGVLIGLVAGTIGCSEGSHAIPAGKAVVPPTPMATGKILAPAATEATGDLASFQGTWVAANVEWHEGFQLLPKEDPHLLEGVVQGHLFTVINLQSERIWSKKYFSLALDATKMPKTIDLIDTDNTGSITPKIHFPSTSISGGAVRSESLPRRRLGIYRIDGQTITIAIALQSGVTRPTEFKPIPRAIEQEGERILPKVIVIHLQKK